MYRVWRVCFQNHCCWTLLKASGVERLCMFGSWTLCQVEEILRAGNRWEMTLKNVVPSICLSQWLIAGVGERSILMLHKCDLRLFRSCVGGKNSWCICQTLEGSLLIQEAKNNIFYCYFILWLFPLEPLITGKSSCPRRYSSYQRSFAGGLCTIERSELIWGSANDSAGFVRHNSYADSRRLSQMRLNHHHLELLWHRRLTSLQGCHHNLRIFYCSVTLSCTALQ